MTDWQQLFVTVASAISAIVLNALWQDALLVLCVWLLLRAWPRINAATRYVVWSATLVAGIVLPVGTTLAYFAPPHHVSVAQVTAGRSQRTSSERPEGASRGARTSHHERVESRAAVLAPQGTRLPERLHVTLPASVALGIFTLWTVLAAYALVRLAIGLIRLEQLKRDALPLPVEYRDAMPQWLRANKGARDVRLCVSDETDVPVAVGLFDAMILVPRSLLERLSEPEVDQICLHELAHLRRADDWTNGFQRIVSALLGWNPAAQFIGQQLDLEREVACDDWVLSFIGKVRPYALCLTKMAESASWPRHAIPAPGVFATRKHISLRIERLLGAGRNIATNLSMGPAAAAVAVVGAIALVAAFVAPSVAASSVAPAVDVTKVTIAPPSPKAATQARKPVVATETQVNIPATRVSVPATHVNVPATHVNVPATHVDVPATHVYVPAMHVDVPATHVDVPATHIDVPGANVTVPAMHFSVPGLKSTIAQAETSCGGCDLSGVNWPGRDLHGIKYSGVDFSRANLPRVNFSGSTLNGADFSSANLQGASFRNARLAGCDFSKANLSGADFAGATIAHCDFSGINLHNVNFSGAKIVGSDFGNAVLEGANLTGASLTGCDLSGVNLSGVDLSKTKISGSDFSEENLPPSPP
jgi:uncharacterized protein YjbI with pentapeptide repeats/beta-lactamase regulating signal transducer with metallopeptidase domain